jgi:hypothetical protein
MEFEKRLEMHSPFAPVIGDRIVRGYPKIIFKHDYAFLVNAAEFPGFGFWLHAGPHRCGSKKSGAFLIGAIPEKHKMISRALP